MKQLIKWIDKALALAMMSAMAGILLAVTWQVFSRYLLQDPSSGTEELARFLLIWIGVLGAAYAYRKKAHLGFNLLVERQSPQGKRVLLTIVELLAITFSAMVLLYGGSELVILTLELEQISAALNIKIGYVYGVLPLAGALIILYSLINLYDLWFAPAGEEI